MNGHFGAFFAAAICLALCSCSIPRRDLPPEHGLIEQAYFKCEKCHALEGGNYGKGPFKRFRSSESPRCVHAWQRISREEFGQLASQWHGVAWDNEIPFWQDRTSRPPE